MNEENIKETNRLRKLVKNAVEYRQAQRDEEYINNEAHYEGLHWQLSDMGSDSPFIVKSDINHLKNAVDIRLGSLCASSYYGILKPLSKEDVERIEDLNILYKNEWNRLNLDKLVKEAVKAGCKFDNGYIEFGFDTDKIIGGTNAKREGVITAKFIETANVYLDPSAENIDSCEYFVKKIKFTTSELKREFPEWWRKLEESEKTGSASKSNDTGNIFTGRDYNTHQDNIIVVDAIYEKYKTEIEVPVEQIEDDENVIDEVKTEKIKATRVKISYITDNILLEVKKDYPFDVFPLVPFQWESVPQSPYGIPLLRGLTVPQKVANLIESSINNIAVHYTIPTWVISDDSGLEVDDVAKLINALGVVWKVTDINTAIKQLEPPKINSDIITMGQTFVGYIKEYAGVTGQYVGNIGTAGSTAEGTSDAIARATIIDNNPIDQIADFVERLTRVLIKFMVRYYKDDIIYIRDDLEEGSYAFSEIKIDYDDINFDFDVDLGSRSRNDRNRQYNLIKEIYQLQNQYKDTHPVINVTDVIKAAHLDNYNEMKTRMENATEEALQEKAALMIQLVEMGSLQTPNGTPLIDPQTLSEGIMDVLNDDNNLETAQSIIDTYTQYQEEMTALKQQLSQNYENQRLNRQQTLANNNQNMI